MKLLVQNHNRYIITAKTIYNNYNYNVLYRKKKSRVYMLYIIMLTMANKPETVWYRLPTFSHLCASHGGIILVYGSPVIILINNYYYIMYSSICVWIIIIV